MSNTSHVRIIVVISLILVALTAIAVSANWGSEFGFITSVAPDEQALNQRPPTPTSPQSLGQ